MSLFLPVLITWMQLYGYPALWLTIFVAAIGIPLPVSLMLLAAGAFAALGDFNVFLVGVIAVTASTCGDQVGYLLGRSAGVRVLMWLEHPRRFNPISVETLQRSHLYFRKRGGLAIFLSRSIVSVLGGTINLLAGAEVYPYHRFLLYDICGEACAAIIPLVLGYTFGASWEAIGDVLGTTSLFIIALLVAICLSYWLIRILQRMKATSAFQEHRVEEKRASVLSIKESPDSLPL
jgi:membrane-associated protein